MYNLTPIRSLPVATPLSGYYDDNFTGLREDGSFDFTQFFTNFDLDSDAAKYLDKWDPAKFLAILRVAAQPVPRPPQRKSNEEYEKTMAEYKRKLEARSQAKEQLEKDIETLDGIIMKMDEAKVPATDQLRSDFTAAKSFIFDAVANSSSRVLDIHLEFEDPLSAPGTPRTPAAPVLGTVPLPTITPVGTPGAGTPLTPGKRWPSMLTGPDGLVYRVVATPREIPFDSNYFPSVDALVIPATPSPSRSSPRTSRPPPVTKRPASNWLRTLSELRASASSQSVEL